VSRAKYGKRAVTMAKLERWENPFPDRDYIVDISFPEFTCLCPRSGYPDFATMKIEYIPDKFIVELKSLKLYLNGFRERSISHESSTNQVFDDLKKLLKPRRLDVTGDFNPRGNVKTVIRVSTEGMQRRRS
jgi:7-cyano-7-deazaguanine reductase